MFNFRSRTAGVARMAKYQLFSGLMWGRADIARPIGFVILSE